MITHITHAIGFASDNPMLDGAYCKYIVVNAPTRKETMYEVNHYLNTFEPEHPTTVQLDLVRGSTHVYTAMWF